METPKRGRGRPRKLPPGHIHTVRLVLVNGEMEHFREACDAVNLSQTDFSRAAVLHAADVILGQSPPRPLPKKKRK